MIPKNPNDCTDDSAMVPVAAMIDKKSATGVYNESGLPKPPAGYGKQLGSTPMYAPDTCC